MREVLLKLVQALLIDQVYQHKYSNYGTIDTPHLQSGGI